MGGLFSGGLISWGAYYWNFAVIHLVNSASLIFTGVKAQVTVKLSCSHYVIPFHQQVSALALRENFLLASAKILLILKEVFLLLQMMLSTGDFDLHVLIIILIISNTVWGISQGYPSPKRKLKK